MFENIKVQDIHATRYIASWLVAGGQFRHGGDVDDFYEWLLSMGLSEDEANHIKLMATCGKMELETNAKLFLKARSKK